MASANTSLRVSDLDFNSIRDNLKTYLNSQSEFTDYNFEGSGLSVLLDILAYNTYYNSFYLNMVANEAFLDTSQIRQNILSQAKLINYIPASAHASEAMVSIRVTPSTSENQTTDYIVLDKYTRLLGADIEGKSYPFVTLNSNTASKSAGSFYFPNVWIKQGEVITQQFLMAANNTTAKFEIPSANVDTETITITVQESSSNTYTEEYQLSEDITTITSNSRTYFLEENENLNYTLQFGDGILGYRPKNGNIIIATYIDTQGSEANDVSLFNVIDPIGGLYTGNVRVTTVSNSRTGADKESIEKVKLRAPQYYTAQNRCVTVRDYETILMKDYQHISAVSIWGGEDNDPPVYGKVYISIKTKGYYTLTTIEKENIKNNLIKNRNVVTVTPVIVDPDYIFITVRGKVYYNPSMTTKTANQILNNIKQAVYQYADDELNTYRSTFKKSKLQSYIETSDSAITGTDITIYLQSRQKIDTTQSKKYYYYFNTSIEKGTFTNKMFSYPQITVLDTSNTPRNVFYEEVPDSFTGVDMIEVTNSGRDYAYANVVISGDGSGAAATARIVNGRILSIDVTSKGINYSRSVITITGNGVEAEARAVLQARNGTLRTYYYDDIGNKIIVNSEAGTIDYDTGEIVLNSIKPSAVISNDYYDTDILTISAVPGGEVIPPLRNRILTVDDNNIQSVQIEMIAEK
ncbi:hypothetical protein EB001_13090 [bacterium]|nr:hypothetical protein [bacterium]